MNSKSVSLRPVVREFVRKHSSQLALFGVGLFVLALLTMAKAPALLVHDASDAPAQAATQQLPLVSPEAAALQDSLKANAETIRWIENKGQLPPQVLYSYTIPGSRVYLERDRLRFEFVTKLTGPRAKDDLAFPTAAAESQLQTEMVSHSFVVHFDDANPNPAIEPGDTFDTTYNYFKGNDPTKWASNVRAYKELTLRDLYPGISLRLYSQADRQLEYDWILEPGADYRLVNLRFEGADDVAIAADGSLDIALRFGSVHFKIPESYQVTPAGKQPVTFAFAETADDRVTFQTLSRVDPQYALVIDPTLEWGTWFDQNSAASGPNAFDQYLFATAVDTSTGDVYCAGIVNVGDTAPYLPGGGFDTSYNSSLDAIVYVLASDGKTLKSATYYGTSGSDRVYGLSLSNSRVFIAGRSDSASLPMTTGAGSGDDDVAASFDATKGDGSDGFVAVFPKALNYLTYATFLGASISGGSNSDDTMYSIRALSDTSFVVSGIVNGALSTSSPNYIVNAPDTTQSGTEAYIAKFRTLNTLTFGTYVGGDGNDQVNDIQIMGDDRVAFVGTTDDGGGWPSQVNSQASNGSGTGGFVGTILSGGGSSFQYLDRIGGNATDRFNGLDLDGDTLYWTGSSGSTNFPGVSGNFQTTVSGESGAPPAGSEAFTDMIIAKVTVPASGSPSGYEATYFGGSPAVTGSEAGTVGVVLKIYKPTCSNATYLMIFGARIGDIGASRVRNINSEPFYNPTWQSPAGTDRPDMLIVIFRTDLTDFYYSTLVGGTFQDYFGDTGAARGSNHLTVHGDKFTLGTTSHSASTGAGAHVPQVIGDSTGSQAAGSVFDPTRNPGASTGSDVHIIFRVSFVSDDYGDAPTSYGTGTAAHRISCIETTSATSLRLGALVDPEGAGNPGNASGAVVDDTTGTADEDSLTQNTGLDVTNTSWNSGPINVLNNTGGDATLYGWIDFNLNGVFDAGEGTSITISSSPSVQTTSLTWSGLSGLVAGSSYLRLRLTTTAGLNATASAPNGEIEDYPITISSTPTSVELANFKAALKSASVKLVWRTGQETDLVGFNVWRRRGTGEWEKMTTDLVPAKNPGSLTGAKYNFKDKDLKPGKKHRYKIELVDKGGNSTWSEVIQIQVPKP